MLKMVKGKKGFTLIELMIVVAIVGILAAIAIPAYLDYTVKSKLSEVTAAMDALSTAASEYHASTGYFPLETGNYATDQGVNGFAAVSRDYVSNWAYDYIDRNNCAFEAFLNLTPVQTNHLNIYIHFTKNQGYAKSYGGNMPPKFLPKK
jgi:prepilin-type N-terminal cleavage/methylation domain-containing protein